MPKPLASIDWERHDQLEAQGMKPKQIAAQLHVPPATLSQRKARRRLEQQAQAQSTPQPDDVHDDADGAWKPLPDGYAAVIQPMREYTEAEDAALHESMRLYGFIGAIVRDQYGRILDGNQRQRVAQILGLDVPWTITQVKDDAHAIELARAANVVRRHYPRAQREQIALAMRDQGWSYRLIAEALGVSVNTVQRDTAAVLKSTPEARIPKPSTIEPHPAVLKSTPDPGLTVPAAPSEAPPAPSTPLVHTRDGRSHPSTRTTRPKTTTSKIDRQVAQVIDLLMKHVHQWDAKHWQTFLKVVQSLQGGRASAPASE